jgi:hypothetical protein
MLREVELNVVFLSQQPLDPLGMLWAKVDGWSLPGSYIKKTIAIFFFERGPWVQIPQNFLNLRSL